MKIIVHRGIDQIGGCITEIQSGDDRILIDLGSNLPGTDGPDFTDEEVKSITTGAKAILFTHYHGDHVGHYAKATEVPQYIGEGAKRVLDTRLRVLGEHIPDMHTFVANKPLQLGCLTVTPFNCSHSAFDAFMFKITDGKKTILHTGDFRSHGYIGKGLYKFIPTFVGQVDALITEGTMLSRASEHVPTEAELQMQAQRLLTRKAGTHQFFALCSSTDMDRLASFHLACRKTGAWLVVDHYQKEVLDIFTEYAGPRSDAFVFDRVKVLGSGEEFFNEIKETGFIMTIRKSQYWQLLKYRHCFPCADLIYSMWDGYRHGSQVNRDKDILRICDLFGDDHVHTLHTSGHATPQAIRDVVEMTQPREKIIVIHKDKRSRRELLDLPEEYRDKVVWNFENNRENGIEI